MDEISNEEAIDFNYDTEVKVDRHDGYFLPIK
jgi:hypothetical protein